MKTCLLSGSTGFLGSKLAARLAQLDYQVVRLPRGLLQHPEELEDFIQDEQPDYIFHLAAYGNMAHHQDREEIIRANIVGTFNLLEATKEINYKRFINVSSSSVMLPVQTLYSASKKAAEALTEAYKGKPIINVRPYSITGVGEQPEHLIPTLIEAAYLGKRVNLVPEPVHDYIDVEDVVSGLVDIAVEPGFEDLLCLGSGKSYTNLQVKELVEDVVGKPIHIEIVRSLRSFDTTDWQSPHDWSQKTLQQSIEEMVKDYEKQRAKT